MITLSVGLLICDKLNLYKRAKPSSNTHDVAICFVANSVYASLDMNMKATKKNQRWYFSNKKYQKINNDKKYLVKYVNANLLLVLKAQ